MDHSDRRRINQNIIIKFIILVFDDYRPFKYNSSLDSPDTENIQDAFQEWKTQLMFTSYEYKESLLTPDRIEPDYIPYMKQMKEHLNKAYRDLLPNP